MKLQTKIPLEPRSKKQIDYHSNVFLVGSCFSENIGNKLTYFKFKTYQNPFGILFHPKAIESLLNDVVSENVFSSKDVFCHNEQWHCYKAHSAISNASKAGLLNSLNEQVALARNQIKKASHIVITLGTAWVYEHVKSNKVVANCHKVPQKEFQKKLLSVDSIVESINNMVSFINQLNTKVSIIFTVSPVRHLKDGYVANTQSKSHLISAIHQVLNNPVFIKKVDCSYFPSYEIMMDELRDYRFYKDDMVHPSPLAIQYIWEQFKSVWISQSAFGTIKAVENIHKGLQHKTFNPDSLAHQRFLEKLQHKIEELQSTYAHITF
ncbi:GSCFA domain-containing protein [Cognatitamlana onchidii]|uniref:GSCFA domain-containing protein n=1 Tax=Cognatitamlana onchidii TaxID=2562860 RepID=UPI0010A63228|nr:GSCFA domain-containing protein [Algibacter onchidii]